MRSSPRFASEASTGEQYDAGLPKRDCAAWRDPRNSRTRDGFAPAHRALAAVRGVLDGQELAHQETMPTVMGMGMGPFAVAMH
jgi:hypothetical protein